MSGRKWGDDPAKTHMNERTRATVERANAAPVVRYGLRLLMMRALKKVLLTARENVTAFPLR